MRARRLRPDRPRVGRSMLAPHPGCTLEASASDLRMAAAPGGRTVIGWGNVHGTGHAAIAWAGDTTAGDPPLHVPLSTVLRLATRTEGA